MIVNYYYFACKACSLRVSELQETKDVKEWIFTVAANAIF